MDTKEASKSMPSSHHEEELNEKPEETHIDLQATFENDEANRYRQLRRKLDIRIIPILAVLYLLSFLDRGKRY